MMSFKEYSLSAISSLCARDPFTFPITACGDQWAFKNSILLQICCQKAFAALPFTAKVMFDGNGDNLPTDVFRSKDTKK
jgi:hypothetical protein